VLSGFRREVVDNWAILGYYVACSGNTLPTFRDSLLAPLSRVKNPRRENNLVVSLTPEDIIDRLSRNVGKDLPLQAAQYSGRAHFSGRVMHDLNEAITSNVIARNVDSERHKSVQEKQVISLAAAEMWRRRHSCSSIITISYIFERNKDGNKVSCAITQSFISCETSCYKKITK
jgi:hypothetical protein